MNQQKATKKELEHTDLACFYFPKILVGRRGRLIIGHTNLPRGCWKESF